MRKSTKLESFLIRGLTSSDPGSWLEKLKSSGQLRELSDDLNSMVGFGGIEEGHKDLWEHVKLVVEQSDKIPDVRIAALFHDVGKVRTFKKENGKVTFWNHEIVSSRIFESFCRRWGVFISSKDRISKIIIRLGKVESYNSSWTDSAVRRLSKELDDCFEDVVRLSSADITTKNIIKRKAILKSLEEFKTRVNQIREIDSKKPNLPKGIGNLISEVYKIEPGPSIKIIKDKLDFLIEEKELETGKDLNYYKDFLEKNSEIFLSMI